MLRLPNSASLALALVLGCGLTACTAEVTPGDASHDHDDHAGHDHEGHDHAEGEGHEDGHDHDGDGKADHDAHEHAAVEYVKGSADYTLTTCVVSGEDLGDLEDRVVIKHEGREVQFCCEMCVETFQENPDKFMAKLGDK